MDKLFVYGDFDWLERPELIGELSFESIRGNATYASAIPRSGCLPIQTFF